LNGLQECGQATLSRPSREAWATLPRGGRRCPPRLRALELILFRAAPRRDTKPLAKAILARFGTFAEALSAPEELLAEVPGIGETAITELKLVRAVALRLMRGEVLDRPVQPMPTLQPLPTPTQTHCRPDYAGGVNGTTY
jgi:hypothetical protein